MFAVQDCSGALPDAAGPRSPCLAAMCGVVPPCASVCLGVPPCTAEYRRRPASGLSLLVEALRAS
ncbi:hypothetical protein DID96_18255 [Burkholderia sp. Bp8963]|nr:hypothetical protein DID96_18255 [Burkholderia sp. Bp8963]